MRPDFDHLAASWTVWALLSAVFAALTAIFAKVGVEGVDSDFATFIRTLIVVAVLGLLLSATGRLQPTALSPKTLAFLTLSGLATGASWLCYFRALKLGDAARVAPIDKLSVVLVAAFGVLFLGERLSTTNWLGVALIGCGALLVAFRG
ncbi:EamA family transporter [uncultured Rhodoblastus sp.]|uniref:EamA family transporter n=1 Tax=uncultured Rhodoblastus sp. TaxID=543037 RepID=UPI0025E0AC35|nr:EamA family transporter [uncultured Rhodoblastus sp.]